MEDFQNKQLVPVNVDFGSIHIDEDYINDEYVEMPQTILEEDTIQKEEHVDPAQMASQTQLSDREMARELINSRKTFGDSKEMKAVKTDLMIIEELLKKEANKPAENKTDRKVPIFSQNDMSKFMDAYLTAIRHCDEYRAKGKPSSQVGRIRYELVIKNRDRLLREAALVAEASELILSGRLETGVTNMEDAIYAARLYRLCEGPEEKMGPVREKTSTTKDKVLADTVKMFKPSKTAIKDKKAAKQYADDIMALRRELKDFPPGKIYATFVHLNGEYIKVSQDEHGAISLGHGDSSVVMKEDVAGLINYLDIKMVEEQDRMNPEDMAEILFEQRPELDIIDSARPDGVWEFQIKDSGGIQKTSTLLGRYLELKTKKPATFFSNMNDTSLRWLATELARGMDVKDALKTLEKCLKDADIEGRQINTNETLELVASFSMMKEAMDVDSIVEYKTAKPVKKIGYGAEHDKEAQKWIFTQEEEQIKDMTADLIFSQETWVADDVQAKPGERMRLMLMKHADIFATIFADSFREDQNTPSIMDKFFDKLPLEAVGKDPAELKNQLRSIIIEFNAALDNGIDEMLMSRDKSSMALIPKEYNGLSDNQLKGRRNEIKRNKTVVLALLNLALSSKNKMVMKELKAMDASIEKMVKSFSNDIQDTITQKTNDVFGSDDGPQVDRIADLKDPNEKGITPQEKKARIKAGEKALNKMMEDALKGETGQGRFVKIIFNQYFKEADPLDQRCMLASAIKNMGPKKKLPEYPKDATEEQKKAIDEQIESIHTEEAGEYLGGILKGAGPLFQKILQGLPAAGMHPSIARALDDMKSKLAPIPEEIVKAQLLGMVQRSKGKITKIKVDRALGAASVGQTFLCKIYGPNLPEEGKDVVVKLLKPDVRNRMMREKKVMLECARQTDESHGMEATYLGQLSRIEEELDLTIEARNVVEGNEVYDAKEGEEFKGVSSMKLNDLIDPTVNSMVLEKAPGETVDRYIKELQQEIEELKAQMQPTEEERKAGSVKKDATPEEIERVNAIRLNYTRRVVRIHEELITKLESLMKRQKYMTAMADKWVTEGIFREGFYHGDLHAGNIMVDDNGATLIDFGNATKLSEKQQVEVTRMVGAAAVGDAEGFRDGLHALIKPEFEPVYKAQKKKLTDELKRIFSCGDKNCAGQRVAVALLKAQELGLEVPSAIFNFSQCQIRLQNTIDTMNNTVDTIGDTLREINKTLLFTCNPVADFYTRAQTMRFAATYLDMGVAAQGDQTQELNKEKASELFARSYENIFSEADFFSMMEEKDVENFLNTSKSAPTLMKQLGEMEEDMAKVRKILDTKVNELIERKAQKGEEAVKGEDLLPTEEVGNMYAEVENALKPLGRILAKQQYKDELRVYIKEISSDIASGKYKTADEVKASEAYAGHMHRFDASIQKAKDIEAKYNAIIEKKDKATEEEKKDLVKVLTVFNNENRPFLDNSPLGNLLNEMVKTGKTTREKEIRNRIDQEIRMISEEDEQLGEEIASKYKEFRQDQDAGAEYFKLYEEIVGLYRLLAKVSEKKAAKPLENMQQICKMGQPATFVDVMGNTIVNNLSTSFARLGFFTAISYEKKLSEKEPREGTN
ncbi:MAG: phosphotransferase [Lachnospiraceae bacterium]|nr:phosphotransferase [Lachnospiraceae bacterium]